MREIFSSSGEERESLNLSRGPTNSRKSSRKSQLTLE